MNSEYINNIEFEITDDLSDKDLLVSSQNKSPELNKVLNEDCITYLSRLPDTSVDMLVLDPPYYQVVKEDWDNNWPTLQDYLNWMETIIQQLYRVSKYSCSVWLFGYAYQLGHLIPLFEKHGFTYRQHITINKGIKSVAGRTSSKLKMFPTATEYAVYLHKESRHIIKQMLQDKQKETKIKSSDINLTLGKAINGGGTWSTIAGIKQKNIQYPTREDWDKLDTLFGGFDCKYDDLVYKFNSINGLTDVWDDINFYDRTYKKTHPTQKPYKLIERIVKCSTNEGDIVLDIFMGSAMTGLVCKDLGRNFYGCELEAKYFENNLLSS